MIVDQYKELHKYCQNLKPKVGRNLIINKIKEITGKQVVTHRDQNLDPKKLRGYFVAADRVQFVAMRDKINLIMLAKTDPHNECWDRFVNVKEAMHLFDNGQDLTDTSEKFEQLLVDWCSPVKVDSAYSPQKTADMRAIWLALSCFCPENVRLDLVQKRKNGILNDYDVALTLKIPEVYVPALMMPEFDKILKSVIGAN